VEAKGRGDLRDLARLDHRPLLMILAPCFAVAAREHRRARRAPGGERLE
jgi:hypothetical protein